MSRLRTSPLSGGKKGMFVSLNLTAMVDMFTILVIFLIQLFTAAGQVTLNDRIHVPKSVAGTPLEVPGTVIMLNNEGVLLLDNQPIPSEEMGSELDISIPGMVTRLTQTRESQEKLFGRDPNQPYDGIIIIQADIKTDFRIVRRVLTSANEAGWAKIKFVTIPTKAPGDGDAAAAPAAG